MAPVCAQNLAASICVHKTCDSAPRQKQKKQMAAMPLIPFHPVGAPESSEAGGLNSDWSRSREKIFATPY
jgi:hypothetical protein